MSLEPHQMIKKTELGIGLTVWLTGLPCSGKSTLARLLKSKLQELELAAEILDGDDVRKYLNKGLGFSRADREENIRRIAYVAKLLTRVGGIAIIAAVSPYNKSREEARAEVGNFVEVYVQCPLEVCIQRDVKDLYAKAQCEEISNFTGISDPYEEPTNPEIIVRTDQETPAESLNKILSRLAELKFIPPSTLMNPAPSDKHLTIEEQSK